MTASQSCTEIVCLCLIDEALKQAWGVSRALVLGLVYFKFKTINPT